MPAQTKPRVSLAGLLKLLPPLILLGIVGRLLYVPLSSHSGIHTPQRVANAPAPTFPAAKATVSAPAPNITQPSGATAAPQATTPPATTSDSPYASQPSGNCIAGLGTPVPPDRSTQGAPTQPSSPPRTTLPPATREPRAEGPSASSKYYPPPEVTITPEDDVPPPRRVATRPVPEHVQARDDSLEPEVIVRRRTTAIPPRPSASRPERQVVARVERHVTTTPEQRIATPRKHRPAVTAAHQAPALRVEQPRLQVAQREVLHQPKQHVGTERSIPSPPKRHLSAREELADALRMLSK